MIGRTPDDAAAVWSVFEFWFVPLFSASSAQGGRIIYSVNSCRLFSVRKNRCYSPAMFLPVQNLHGLSRGVSLMNDGFEGDDHPGRIFGLEDISPIGDAKGAGPDDIVGDLEERFGIFHLGTASSYYTSVTGIHYSGKRVVITGVPGFDDIGATLHGCP